MATEYRDSYPERLGFARGDMQAIQIKADIALRYVTDADHLRKIVQEIADLSHSCLEHDRDMAAQDDIAFKAHIDGLKGA